MGQKYAETGKFLETVLAEINSWFEQQTKNCIATQFPNQMHKIEILLLKIAAY